jgi:hypothetical protein
MSASIISLNKEPLMAKFTRSLRRIFNDINNAERRLHDLRTTLPQADRVQR